MLASAWYKLRIARPCVSVGCQAFRWCGLCQNAHILSVFCAVCGTNACEPYRDVEREFVGRVPRIPVGNKTLHAELLAWALRVLLSNSTVFVRVIAHPLGPKCEARLLRIEEGANTKRCVFGQLSMRSFQSQSLFSEPIIFLLWSNRALKFDSRSVRSLAQLR